MGKARVALTDWRWFESLRQLAARRAAVDPALRTGRLDEANFWQPRGPRRPQLDPGSPFFLRHLAPRNSIGGFGFFSTWRELTVAEAWRVFGPLNGATTWAAFLASLQHLRGGAVNPDVDRIGCMVIRDVHFLPPERWLHWAATEEWKRETQVSKDYELEAGPGAKLRALITSEARPDYLDVAAEFAERFSLIPVDEREHVDRSMVVREGQRSFRLRLLEAYEGRCALTGEHTEPVLEAAHIQDYLGPRSNHVQNGLLLRADLHDLYDQGYLAVVPRQPSGAELVVEVSQRIDRWNNGKIYKALHGRSADFLPKQAAHQPSREALVWHAGNRFR